MKRLTRILGGVAVIGSLVLGVLVVVVWVATYRVERRWGFVTAAGRYTIHARGGRVVLSGPPPEVRGAGAGRGDAGVLAQVTNEQFCFLRTRHGLKDEFVLDVQGRPVKRSDAMRAWMLVLGSGNFNRELLKLLDDPERFVAGHCLLVATRLPAASAARLGKPVPREPVAAWVNHDGLRVELREELAEVERGPNPGDEWAPRVERFPVGAWGCDPAQMAVVRELWHDRLDVAVGSAPVWPAVVGCLVLPGVWGYRRIVRGVRRRSGCCVGCGYDLRGTPGGCPECGAGVG